MCVCVCVCVCVCLCGAGSQLLVPVRRHFSVTLGSGGVLILTFTSVQLNATLAGIEVRLIWVPLSFHWITEILKYIKLATYSCSSLQQFDALERDVAVRSSQTSTSKKVCRSSALPNLLLYNGMICFFSDLLCTCNDE